MWNLWLIVRTIVRTDLRGARAARPRRARAAAAAAVRPAGLGARPALGLARLAPEPGERGGRRATAPAVLGGGGRGGGGLRAVTAESRRARGQPNRATRAVLWDGGAYGETLLLT